MFILRLQCTDTPGIVAAVSTALRDTGCNIEESAQFYEHSSGLFFMRILFSEVARDAAAKFAETFAPPRGNSPWTGACVTRTSR